VSRGSIEAVGFVKPCLMLFSCPGDSGDTVVYWKGASRQAKKDDAVVKLYGVC
jgi:cob(I)alamin adenosyltransferase